MARPSTFNLPNGKRCCKSCHGQFPATSEYFPLSYQTGSGLRSYCIPCWRAIKKAAKAKAKPQATPFSGFPPELLAMMYNGPAPEPRGARHVRGVGIGDAIEGGWE